MEAQALEYRREVEIKTYIKLELTAVISIRSRSIDVAKHITLVQAASTQEVLTINDIAGSTNHVQCRLSIRVDHVDRNQWRHTVRTESASQLPILVTIVCRLRAIIGCIGVHISRNSLAQLNIHITSNTETIRIILLCLAKV